MAFLPEEPGEQFRINLYDHGAGVCVGDIDGDGDQDLFVTNAAGWTTEYNSKSHDYAGAAGLFVANMFGRSQLYRNNGKGRFTDVTRETLGRTPWGTAGARAFDYDNDGKTDLYLVDRHSDMRAPHEYDPARIAPQRKYPGFSAVWRRSPGSRCGAKSSSPKPSTSATTRRFSATAGTANRGDGTFEETSAKAGAETYWPWGIAEGDFDNDGDIDAFLASGMGYPYYYPNFNTSRENGTGFATVRCVVVRESAIRGIVAGAEQCSANLPRCQGADRGG